jgi:hypothetical protein
MMKKEGIGMLYTQEAMLKTKERLQDLRKERKWSYEMLERKLYERGAHIDRNTLWAFEVDDQFHPKYQRTRKMRIEQLVALTDIFDVSVEYLLGISDFRKREYQGIGKELNLTPSAVDRLKDLQKDRSAMYILNRLLVNDCFIRAIYFLRKAVTAEKLHQIRSVPKTQPGSFNPQELENARNVLRKYGLIDTPARLVSRYHARNAVEEMSKAFKGIVENMVVQVGHPKSGQKH